MTVNRDAHRVVLVCPQCGKLNEIYYSHYRVLTKDGTKDATIQCKDKHWMSIKKSTELMHKRAWSAVERMQKERLNPNSNYAKKYIQFCLQSKK